MEVDSGILGGDRDPTVFAGPYAVTLTRLPPRLQLPPHEHKCATLNLVLEGEYGESVDQRAIRSYLSATVIAKPGGTVHANQVGPAPVECLVIELTGDSVAAFQERLPLFIDDVVVLRSAQVARIGGCLRTELTRRDEVTPLAVEGLVLELVAALARTSLHRPETRNPWIDRARDLLHDEPGIRSLSDLASRIGLSPIYVARAFRARFACSVGEYARCLRVERASHLLRHTTLSLSEVASEAGYSDQSHMSREFRRVFDQSPGAYRLRAREA